MSMKKKIAWIVPMIVGAAIGTWLALSISDQDFKKLLAFLMVAISLVSFWRPKPPEDAAARFLPLAAGFFLVGIYGGFVQAGVGFLILAVTACRGAGSTRARRRTCARAACVRTRAAATTGSCGPTGPRGRGPSPAS